MAGKNEAKISILNNRTKEKNITDGIKKRE
jgi:hypothetical protein